MKGESPETKENPKIAAWREKEREVEAIVDKLGKRVDRGIKEAVVALRVLGFETDGSCEGHLDSGVMAPWIDICDVPEDVISRVKRGRAAGGKFSEEDMRIINETQRKLKEDQARVANLLQEFYKDRPFSSGRRLMVELYGDTIRIRSQGAKAQGSRSSAVRASKLREYKEEMHDFTEFLREKVLSQS